MEIKVTIDNVEAQRAAPATGGTAAAGSSQQGGEERGGPPPEIAAAAAAVGAIDAGPAHIPPGESGQALANVAAAAQPTAVGQSQSALAAGAAPGYTLEAEEVIEVEGEAQE
jgi:hypothetical protein